MVPTLSEHQSLPWCYPHTRALHWRLMWKTSLGQSPPEQDSTPGSVPTESLDEDTDALLRGGHWTLEG